MSNFAKVGRLTEELFMKQMSWKQQPFFSLDIVHKEGSSMILS